VTSAPTCSVVVPTHARPRQLAACLDALARLAYPRDRLEVVVVDDGGPVPLEQVVDSVRDRLDVTLTRQRRSGPAAARNVGARLASGELVAFTDDDCIPAPDWLRRLAARYQLDPARAFGGRTVNALPRNAYATTSQLVITVGYERNNADPEDARFFASNNLAFPRAAFLELGGFDETFTTSEDRELCARWRLSGRRLSYVEDAVVLHRSELTMPAFWRQFFHYGRGAFRYRRVQRERTGRRVPIEPSYHRELVRRALVEPSIERRLLVAGLTVLWHVANAAGFAYEWRGSRARRPRLSVESASE
jgi:GT2 family glycosyltransferase